MTAFVLGNGISRESVDVNELIKLHPVYGCNALYRTHTPTVLVATDQHIARAIQESGYSKSNRFYTRRPFTDSGAMQVPKPYFGFSSGPIAVALAAMEGHKKIYLIGFDMGPTSEGKFNNVYAGTEFYKTPTSEPTFTGNWIKQICRICDDFADSVFVRVHGSTTADITEFDSVKNLSKLPMQEFLARINTAKDL